MTDEGAGATRTCPWCSAPVADDATRCPVCDAAIAQRESIGELVIPGVTGLDPSMQADRSVLQGVMRVQAVSSRAAMAATPIIAPPGVDQLVQAAFLGPEMFRAAKFAGDLMSVGRGDLDVSRVGEPSELARLAAAQLDEQAKVGGTAEAGEGGPADAADEPVGGTGNASEPRSEQESR